MTKEGRVFGEILFNNPERISGGWLGSAGAENLDGAEQDGGDAVVLGAVCSCGQVNGGARPGAVDGRAVGGVCRGEVDGVTEVVGENGESAGRGEGGKGKRTLDFYILFWSREAAVRRRGGGGERES